MKIFLSTLSVVLTLSFTSCQKKSDPTPQPTKTDHITSSSWTYENAGIDNDRNGTIDLPLSALMPIDSCRIDNILTFKRDNTATTDEATKKCNVGDPQTSSFSWNFADNETNLIISNNIFTLLNGKSKILNLTATQLSLTRDTMGFPVVVLLKH